MASRWAAFERRLRQTLGPDSLSTLRHAVTHQPVLTIGGQQLTGKSTLAHRLAAHFGRANEHVVSAGSVFRQTAAERGLSVAQLSKQAGEEPAIDVHIDMRLCETIARGTDEGVLVVEGRQPAVMATYLKEVLGKQNCHRLYLCCSWEEQAVRFLEREVGESLAVHAKAALQREAAPHRSLDGVVDTLERVGLPAPREVLATMRDNAGRDSSDDARYLLLYGFGDELSYRNRSLYDVVIDTTPNQPGDTFAQALAALDKIMSRDGIR